VQRDSIEGLDGCFEALGCGLDFCEGALRLGQVVDADGELELDEGNVEFEVDLFGDDFRGL
jgi:hypothetical protein